MDLGQNVQQAISRAHPYPEGRWVFIPIESERDAEEFKQLLTMRIEKKQR